MSHPEQKFILRSDAVVENCRSFIAKLPLEDEGKPQIWEVVIRRYVEPRSPSQNASLFGIAYPPLMAHMGLRGAKEMEELHELACGEYFGWVKKTILGRTKMRPRRTTTTDENGDADILPMEEFSKFWTFVQDELGAKNGVYIPNPDPMKRSGRNKPKPPPEPPC